MRSYATVMPTHHSSTPPPPPSVRPRIDITPPSLQAIRQEGFLDDDIELVPPDQAWLNITQASIDQLAKIAAKETPQALSEGLALRVGVDNGGCHGYQYTMALTEERGVDD